MHPYKYQCATDGIFEQEHPEGKAPAQSACPVCHADSPLVPTDLETKQS
ncbi:Uncharacterised protein [Mycobacteroides abscessus subsp. abscessus]|nr:Uncharacterised protein [Mycobacteroides abscessus subsp. abscessus]